MSAETQTRQDHEDHSAAGLWLVMMKAFRSMQVYVESTLTSRGIGLSDFMILEALLHKGDMSMSVLGETVVLAKPSMTAAILRLEKLDYVRRGCELGDRRVRPVALTERGRGATEAIYRQHERDLEQVMADISPKQRESVRLVLKTIGLSARAMLESAGHSGCADSACAGSGCASSD